EPPVALLAYAAAQPGQSIFWPFARFSPEWQAAAWALAHDVPVRFIDLPAGELLNGEEREPPIHHDPPRTLSHAAGYRDPPGRAPRRRPRHVRRRPGGDGRAARAAARQQRARAAPRGLHTPPDLHRREGGRARRGRLRCLARARAGRGQALTETARGQAGQER